MHDLGNIRPRPWLALAAVLGPILFLLFWVILGFASPAYYLPLVTVAPHAGIALPICALSFGPTAPVMNAAWMLSGLLLLLGVVGSIGSVRETSVGVRRICVMSLALSPAGAIACGIFHPQILSFSVRPGSSVYTDALFLTVASPVAAFLIVGWLLRRLPRWRSCANGLLLGSALTLGLLLIGMAPTGSMSSDGAIAHLILRIGLMQRLLLLEIHAWYFALGWLAFRNACHHEAGDSLL